VCRLATVVCRSPTPQREVRFRGEDRVTRDEVVPRWEDEYLSKFNNEHQSDLEQKRVVQETTIHSQSTTRCPSKSARSITRSTLLTPW
jgi:hypothetical protein